MQRIPFLLRALRPQGGCVEAVGHCVAVVAAVVTECGVHLQGITKCTARLANRPFVRL